jgi:hypothetical protein
MQNGNTALAVAPPESPQAKALARALDPMAEWRAMRQQADALVKSGFLPRAVNTPEKAIAIIQTGRELGIGPMQALRCIHIIDGKPTMAAELIAGLVLARVPGSMLQPIETTDARCVVVACRPGGKPVQITFTREDAQRAGLAGKDNWKKYPRAMLRSRAITEAARAVFPDATMGLYDPDELGAVTSQTGEIIEMPATVTETRPAPTTKEHPKAMRAASADIGNASSRDELEAVREQIAKTSFNDAERAQLAELWEMRLEALMDAADDLLADDGPASGRQPGEEG